MQSTLDPGRRVLERQRVATAVGTLARAAKKSA
jgi:hypothetical protein